MNPNPAKQHAWQHIQQRLGYVFKNPVLLQQALTHRSFSPHNNERFEFVGDAILNYTVAKMLFDAFPNLSEGSLSRMRAGLVNRDNLAAVAVSLNIGDGLLLGQGELKSGGFNRPSILADAVEAVFAAISFDNSFDAAEQTIRRLFAEQVAKADDARQWKDAKTLLQEVLQAHRFVLPKYRIEQQTGEGNDTEFTVSCDLGELDYIITAKANSRRAAEQEAARHALVWLEQRYPAKVRAVKKQIMGFR